MTKSTRERLLDAAEHLFATHGFEATSVRAIVAEAAVNVAAVHYHFGSKEALIRAVFDRRIERINQKRLELLNQSIAAAGDQPPPLESIINAFIAPALQLIMSKKDGSSNFARLMARLHAEPVELQRAIKAGFHEVMEEYNAALRNALPHLPMTEIQWRFKFGVGAMGMTMMSNCHLSEGNEIPPAAEKVAEIQKRLVAFVTAGMQAPLKTGSSN